MSKKMIVEDVVAHPKHYEGSTSLECIETMRFAFGDFAVAYFCLCNAFKYLWRYKHKNGIEDVEKARWYVDYVSSLDFADYHKEQEISIVKYRAEKLLSSIELKESLKQSQYEEED